MAFLTRIAIEKAPVQSKVNLNIRLSQPDIEMVTMVLVESDRGAAVVSANYLGDCIKKLPGFPTAIRNFNGQIDWLLNTYGQKKLNPILDEIRRIRNDAAHSHEKFDLEDASFRLRDKVVLPSKKPQYLSANQAFGGCCPDE